MKKITNIVLLTLFTSLVISGAKLIVSSFESNKTDDQISIESIKNNHGTYFEYFSNGNVKRISNYTNGEKDSLQLFFNTKGDTLKSIYFKKGLKQGISTFYDSKGEPVKTEFYFSGKKYSETILNDSIYRYDFLASETGGSIFNSSCSSCHTSKTLTQAIGFKKTDWDVTHDSLPTFINSDSSKLERISEIELEVVQKYILDLSKEEKQTKIPLLVFRKKEFKKI